MKGLSGRCGFEVGTIHIKIDLLPIAPQSRPEADRLGAISGRFKVRLFMGVIEPSGVKLYCVPTSDARGSWKSSILHIAMEGGCFGLSAN
ncbi:hypothetical protein MPTK1_2g20750 [Marchantia polymorpha subsp. ruderalis]